MTPERWRQVQNVFDAASDLSGVERQAYLYGSCEGDSALRDEVDSLLRCAEEPGPFDELAWNLPSPAASAEDDDLEQGTRIGAYRILSKIGEGGMGVVYLAERADGQFEQRVALKLVRRATGAAPLLSRFLNERRILARLAHPNIARLYDGGVVRPKGSEAENGRPYFVMEYVDGMRVDRYCDVHRLDVDARLKLFCKIGEAVQFAHQNMVVHLDLKPSNVLVTSAGEVKLLDFGVAKLLGTVPENMQSEPAWTPTQAITPEYASPEQVCGGPITTATDVYALGIILYEVLTGQRPFRFGTLMWTELERGGSRTLPKRPSNVVRGVEDGSNEASEFPAPDEIARARATLPDKLERRLLGDLDSIVLKALQSDPERRYRSVEQFVDDIRRHQMGLPVHARPDRLSYRASKFIRRHRRGVAAAVLVATSLVGGIAGTAWQARIASEERDRARMGEAKAQQVSSFLVDLFKVADPSEVRGDTVTARELLERGAVRVQAELTGQPAVQADMMHVMGQVYLSLGLRAEARPLLEQALAMRRTVHDEAHPDVAASLYDLARLYYAEGDFDMGERHFREALELRRRRSPGAMDPDLAAIMHGLGILLSDAGKLDEAEPLLREAVDMRRRGPDARHPDLAESLNGLALVLHRKSAFEDAEALFREAVDAGRRSSDNVSPVAISSLRNLARLVHRFDRDYSAAEPMYHEILGMSRALYGDRHTEVAESLSDLAQVVRDKGDYAEAEPIAREGLAMWTALYGERHMEVAISMDILARVLWLKGETNEAESLYRTTLAMRRELVGDAHPHVVGGLRNLATLLQEQRRYGEARGLYRKALELARQLFGEEHVYVALSLSGLAALRQDEGDHEGAERYFRQALDVRERIHEEGHWRIADAKSALAACLTELGRHEEAERLLLESYPVLVSERGEHDDDTRRVLGNIVRLYQAWEKPAETAHYRTLLENAPRP